MGVIKIEGKPISLDDAIINAGDAAIRAALSVDFPDVENAEIEIERPNTPGAPAVATVVKRGTGKGSAGQLTLAEVLRALECAPPYINPAIALSVEILQREAAGDTAFFEEAVRRGDVERAEAAGEREGRAVAKALEVCSLCMPVPSETVPVGF